LMQCCCSCCNVVVPVAMLLFLLQCCCSCKNVACLAPEGRYIPSPRCATTSGEPQRGGIRRFRPYGAGNVA
jgi:hypothetical protein